MVSVLSHAQVLPVANGGTGANNATTARSTLNTAGVSACSANQYATGTGTSSTPCAQVAYSQLSGTPAAPVTVSGTAVAELDFTTCFSAGINNYDLTWEITLLAGSAYVGFQFNTGSGYDTGSNYVQSRSAYNAVGSTTIATNGTSGTNIDFSGVINGTADSAGFYTGTLRLRSVNSTANYKYLDGFTEYGSTAAVPVGGYSVGVYKSTSALTGFRVFSNKTFTGRVTCTPLAQ